MQTEEKIVATGKLENFTLTGATFSYLTIREKPLKLTSMSPIAHLTDYETTTEAARRGDVPYTANWITKLIKEKKVQGIRIGPPTRGGQWLVHMPSLLKYVKDMQELGQAKYRPD